MTCQFPGSGSELIFIGSKYVSVYMHMAEVSVSLVTKWTPPGVLTEIWRYTVSPKVTLTPDTST